MSATLREFEFKLMALKQHSQYSLKGGPVSPLSFSL